MLFIGGVNASFEQALHLDRFDPETLAWAPQSITGAPHYGDYQPAFVWDGKRQRYLSICGQSDTVHCRVSQLVLPADGPATWQLLAVDGDVPGGRSGHFFVYDEVTDRVIVFAGDNDGHIIG